MSSDPSRMVICSMVLNFWGGEESGMMTKLKREEDTKAELKQRF